MIATEPRLEGERLRVLVCDDHALFRRAVVTSLEESGFDVVAEAESGNEAIERATEHAPDLICMDLRMPDGSGIEATAAITRARPWSRVLLLTVSDDIDEIAGAILAGGIGHIRKEEAMSVLAEVAAEVVGGGVHIGRALARRIRLELGRLVDADQVAGAGTGAGLDTADDGFAAPLVVGPGTCSWRPSAAQLALLDAVSEGRPLADAAHVAGIAPRAARTELRAALEGLHRVGRAASTS